MTPNHDIKCEELARFFLDDENENGSGLRVVFSEADIQELAGEIQETIESFIEIKRSKR